MSIVVVILAVLIGLVLLAIGTFMLVDKYIFKDFEKDMFDSIEDSLTSYSDLNE